MREHFEVWWEQVTGPKRFADAIMHSISNELCSVICIPDILPWKHEISDVIIRNQISTSNWFEVIDFKEIDFNVEVGVFLLDCFAVESVKASFAYCQHNTSIEKHLKDNSVLRDKVIWVKNISNEDIDKWVSFFRKYKSNKSGEGSFVLETTKNELRKATNINILNYIDYVSTYDTHLFASIIVSQSSNDQRLHQYITFVTDNLCGLDAELIVNFISDTDFSTTDILEWYKGLSNIISIHELPHKLWRAQIQVAFSLIEEGRIEFVKKYRLSIKNSLPVEQFGSLFENPYDVELGTLMYLLSRKREVDGYNRLVVAPQDFKHIRFLHNLRNKLAHMKCCTADEMRELLYSEFFVTDKNYYSAYRY